MTPSEQREPVLRARAIFFGGRLMRGRATLYRSHVEITGWSIRGRIQRRIPVAAISGVAVDGAMSNQRLYLKLGDETALLQLARGASLWRVTILDLRYDLTPVSNLPLNGADRVSARNSAGEGRLATEKRYALRRVVDDLPESDRSTGTGGRGDTADHPPVQLPSAAAN